MYKKIVNVSKRRDCEILAEWGQGICSHLYYIAAACQGELLDQIQELNHVGEQFDALI